MSRTKATLVGLISIILWSANAGLIRTVTQALGPIGGAATLYTASALLLYVTFGFPKLAAFPRKYLYIASALFCVYESVSPSPWASPPAAGRPLNWEW